jgi:hypothetical protein
MIICAFGKGGMKKNTRKSLVIRGILIVNNIVDKVDKSTKTYKFKTERSG